MTSEGLRQLAWLWMKLFYTFIATLSVKNSILFMYFQSMKAVVSTFLILTVVVPSLINAQVDSLKGLQQEVFLHPADGFTAYTLKKNEFVYNQSPFTLPFPSWAWWGITDNITAEIDLLPLIGGLFQDPFLPVPSLNFRFALYKRKSAWQPTIAFETMYQHLWRSQNQANHENLRIERDAGNSWYNRFNFSWNPKQKLHIHLSAGVTYTENLNIENKDPENYQGAFFKSTINPDFSASLDWRPKPWLSTHMTSSYGTTFVYLDNIPRKYQISYGFRLAPFYNNNWAFLSKLRVELIGFYMSFADTNGSIESILPIFPYFYWQWTFPSRNGRR